MAEAIKQRAHELIEALPDDATWQDLVYALELRLSSTTKFGKSCAKFFDYGHGLGISLRTAKTRPSADHAGIVN